MNLRPVIVAVPQDCPPRSPGHVQLQRDFARVALRHSARLSDAPTGGWEKGDDDVPLPNDGFHWSISHTRLFAAAVVSDVPVGIDIEHVRPRPRELHDALARAGEWKIMGGQSWPSFFRLWTAKEAVLKANGTGIARLLECDLQALEGGRHMTLEFAGRLWRTEHSFHAEHVAAVTCGADAVSWTVQPDSADGSGAELPTAAGVRPGGS